MLAVYFWSSSTEQPAPISAPVHAATTVFGPGAWVEPEAGASLSNQQNEDHSIPPGGLAVTDSQQLLINSALLDVFTFFLLEQPAADNASALQAYLQSKLPPPAYRDATQLADRYQVYMTAHDDLLAAQNLGSPGTGIRMRNIERIADWREQRNRLRQKMLGDNAVQIWYGNDDAQLKQVLDELRQRNDDAAQVQQQDPSVPAIDTDRQSPKDMHSLSNEEQHDLEMLEVMDKATKSFSALKREGQQWTVNYATYLKAATLIDQRTDLTLFQRNQQIQSLLLKVFPTEAERRRARDQ